MVLSFSFGRAVLLLLCGLAITLFGCAKPAASPEPLDPALGVFGPGGTATYLIGVDDKVQVNVWRSPELSIIVPVRPDGMISVPLIGDVQAGGKTPSDVGMAIEQKLSAYVRDPHVAVIVTELRSHEFLSRVRVTGAVRTPKSMPHRQGMTVLDAVLEAGGINEFASANRTKVYRRVKDKTEVVDVELGAILNKGDLETNVMLRPGDVVTVPERLF
jgi:polysaccharide export outer membrane protein